MGLLSCYGSLLCYGLLAECGSLTRNGLLEDRGSLGSVGLLSLFWLARGVWGYTEALARSGHVGLLTCIGSLCLCGVALPGWLPAGQVPQALPVPGMVTMSPSQRCLPSARGGRYSPLQEEVGFGAHLKKRRVEISAFREGYALTGGYANGILRVPR